MGFKDKLGQLANSAINSAKETTIHAANARKEKSAFKKVIKNFGPVQIREEEKLFKIDGIVIHDDKKTHKLGKAILATATMGTSLIVSHAMKKDEDKPKYKEWYDFDELVSYELTEQDRIVVKGGIGSALVGGVLLGGAGLVAGSVIGHRKQVKKVDSVTIRVTLNSFDTPCIIIPLLKSSVKTDSLVYKATYLEAQKIISALDIITHNK